MPNPNPNHHIILSEGRAKYWRSQSQSEEDSGELCNFLGLEMVLVGHQYCIQNEKVSTTHEICFPLIFHRYKTG
jgi:hypothetical protein